jgi:hypothetical protein
MENIIIDWAGGGLPQHFFCKKSSTEAGKGSMITHRLSVGVCYEDLGRVTCVAAGGLFGRITLRGSGRAMPRGY